MEDDVPIGEVLEGNGLPIHLADGSRTRGARSGLSGVELGKNQALGGSPLDNGTPLFPDHSLAVMDLGPFRSEGLLVESSLVRFHLFARTRTPSKTNLLLLSCT